MLLISYATFIAYLVAIGFSPPEKNKPGSHGKYKKRIYDPELKSEKELVVTVACKKLSHSKKIPIGTLKEMMEEGAIGNIDYIIFGEMPPEHMYQRPPPLPVPSSAPFPSGGKAEKGKKKGRPNNRRKK